MSMFRLTPLAAVIFAVLVAPVRADDSAATAENTTELPKVQVTAISSSLQLNTPGTVTQISRQQMDEHLVSNIRDLVRYEPGVSVIGTAGRFGLDSFNIRGLSGNRTRIEIDGVSMPSSFGAGVGGGSFRAGRNFVDLDTVRQVEIVRGPASAIYPSDSLGGMVSLRTKDPVDYLTDGRHVYLSLKEQYDTTDRSLSSAATLAGGNAQNGIVFIFNHREGHETDNKGDIGGYGAARTRPDPLTYGLDSFLAKYVHTSAKGRLDRVTVEGSQLRTKTNSWSAMGGAVGYYHSQDENRRVRGSVGQEYTAIDSPIVSSLEWNVYAQNARSTTDTQTETAAYRRNFNNMPLRERVMGGKLVAVKRLGDDSAVAQSISYGVELSRTTADSWASGYGQSKATGATGTTTPYMPGRYPMHLIPKSDTDRWSVFAEDEITLLDSHLQITPGVRVDRYEYKPDNDALYQKYNPTFVAQNYEKTHTSPKLGVIWRINDVYSVYGNYAQGFRPPLYSEIAGAWNEQPIASINIAYLPNNNLKAETSKGLELGFRGHGTAGWFNVAAYYNKYRDFIWSGYALPAAQVPDWAYQMAPGARVNMFFQAVNAPRAVIKGAEASGALRLETFADALQGWQLKGSASITSGKLIEPGSDGYSPLNTVDPAKLVLGVSYDATQWGAELVGTGVRRHTQLSLPTAFRPPGYATIDLYGHYEPVKNLTLYAGVTNLADRKYWDWGNLNSGVLGNLITGNGANDAGTGGIPADRLTMPGRTFSIAARIAL